MKTSTQTFISPSSAIFIGGEGRSGTTLLKNIIGLNSNVYELLRETNVFVRSFKGNKFFSITERDQDSFGLIMVVLLSIFYRREVAIRKFAILKRDYASALGIWKQKPVHSIKDYDQVIFDLFLKFTADPNVNKLFDRYAVFDYIVSKLAENKSRWVEKTPAHVKNIDEIFRVYPKAKFVAMIRDPRAVLASWRKKDSRKNFFWIIFSWTRIAKLIINAQEKYGATRVHVVKYEDLILNPEPTVKKLVEFLDLDFQKNMLDIKVVSVGSDPADKGLPGFNKGSLGKWKSELNSTELGFIELCTASARQAFGY